MLIGIEAAHATKDKRTGVEEVCWRLIQNFKETIPSSVRVVLYSHRPLTGALAELPPNWSVKVLRWPLGKLWSQLRLSWELLFHPPDVFFAPGQLIPIICPSNTAVFLHDSAFKIHPAAYRFWGRQYLKAMNWWIMRKARLIFTSTNFNVAELKKYYGERASKKTKVVPLGYNSNLFKVLDNEDYTKQTSGKYNLSKPFIMTVGRPEKKKNTANIVKAFGLVREKFDCQLLLTGARTDKTAVGYEEVNQAIQDSSYKSDIICPGWIESSELPALLNQAEVFVFPSLYEGFGIPVLDAMACGCPVVLARGTALEEVGGKAARYVDPGSADQIAVAILALLRDKALATSQTQAGLERVKSYSWPRASRAIWEHLNYLSK